MQLGGWLAGAATFVVGDDTGYVTFAANARAEEDRFLPLHLAEMCRKREE